ncbi:MAG TPA: tRNA guanosine(34) transglycosylase Tgt [bacterium]|nr:tRNA guanosine(34) transglycosylase Tgt [bacterium]
MVFTLETRDAKTMGRCGRLSGPHGTVPTPVFMPVGTQGTVKTLTSQELVDLGARIILSNAYHLYLRPGDQLVAEAGGLHRFASWPLSILTDSGGYQVFSLQGLSKVTDEGVRFQSHLDGSYHFFTPEKVVDIQRNLGSDICMVLDECAPYPCDYQNARTAHERSVKWALRSLEHFRGNRPVHSKEQALYAIVQGSIYHDLRTENLQTLVEKKFDGYAIGGLAVGEPADIMAEITELCTRQLPEELPRYLMGVGRPEDLVTAISLGVDMFDCVIPTRNGRNGTVYTSEGKMVLKNRRYESDFDPIDRNCSCPACRHYSRSYLRHLFQAGEILAMRLATLHNLYFYMDLVGRARQAIQRKKYDAFMRQFFTDYQTNNKSANE